MTVLLRGRVGMRKERDVAWVEGLVVRFGGGLSHNGVGVLLLAPNSTVSNNIDRA